VNNYLHNFFIIALICWAVDLSSLPEIEEAGTVFYNRKGEAEDVLKTLKRNGINTVRLRLWKEPASGRSDLKEVSLFSKRIRSEGLKVWLSVHYSDTWADPGRQEPPAEWKEIPYRALKDSIYSYTGKVVSLVKPDYIEIGNEINSGFLFPFGKLPENEEQFLELISTAAQAVRDSSESTRIIIHYAGVDGAENFFRKLKDVDYDIIGISYYPMWHGKDLHGLRAALRRLSESFNKGVMIAETAYPFTLMWNDRTHNIVGLSKQLILPDFPATPEGQKKFLEQIKGIVERLPRGEGLCYWGAELVAFRGVDAVNGSPWENQALYDFKNRALPAMEVFRER